MKFLHIKAIDELNYENGPHSTVELVMNLDNISHYTLHDLTDVPEDIKKYKSIRVYFDRGNSVTFYYNSSSEDFINKINAAVNSATNVASRFTNVGG